MKRLTLVFSVVLGLLWSQHVYGAAPSPNSGTGALASLDLSPDGRTIVGIVNASTREVGPNAKSNLLIWNVPCVFRGGSACENRQLLPWLESRFEYWQAGGDQFVVDSLTLQQIETRPPFTRRDLKSLAIAKWPKIMQSDAIALPPLNEEQIAQSAIQYVSSGGYVAVSVIERDEELRVASPAREITIPRHLYDIRSLMPFRYEIVVAGDGAGFYWWSGSLGARGQLIKFAGRRRQSIPLPSDLKGSLQIVFPPSANTVAAAYTADGIRGLENPSPLVGLIDDHVQVVRRAQPDLELRLVSVSDDLETWALLFTSVSGSQELHILKPRTSDVRTVVLSRADSDEASPSKPLRSQYISIPAENIPLPARHYALLEGTAPKKLIIRFHGGPTISAASDRFGWVRRLTTQGFDVLDVDYRGSPGYGAKHLLALKRPAAEVMRQDLGAAVAWARAQGYAQVGFLGTSAGGIAGVAALTSEGPKLDFMVLESPLIDRPPSVKNMSCERIKGQTTDRMFGLRTLTKGQCDPFPTGLLERARPTNIPILVFAGRRDARTPFAVTETWAAKAQAGNGCLVLVDSDQGGHTLLAWPKSEEAKALKTLEDWLSHVGETDACRPGG